MIHELIGSVRYRFRFDEEDVDVLLEGDLAEINQVAQSDPRTFV